MCATNSIEYITVNNYNIIQYKSRDNKEVVKLDYIKKFSKNFERYRVEQV